MKCTSMHTIVITRYMMCGTFHMQMPKADANDSLYLLSPGGAIVFAGQVVDDNNADALSACLRTLRDTTTWRIKLKLSAEYMF